MKFIKIIKASEIDKLVEDALYLFENDNDHLNYEFIQYMGYSEVGEFDLDDIKKIIRKDPKKAAKFIRKYIN